MIFDERPVIVWSAKERAPTYQLTVAGDVSFATILDNISCAPVEGAKGQRCSARYPDDKPGLPAGAAATLQLLPRDSAAIGTGDKVWVQRTTEPEAARLQAGRELIESLPVSEVGRDLLLAVFFSQHKLYDEAIRNYEAVAWNNDTSGEVRITLADTYVRVGLLSSARKIYQAAFFSSTKGVSGAAHFGFGYTDYVYGYSEEAAEQFDEAARSFAASGMLDEAKRAREAFERAIK